MESFLENKLPDGCWFFSSLKDPDRCRFFSSLEDKCTREKDYLKANNI